MNTRLCFWRCSEFYFSDARVQCRFAFYLFITLICSHFHLLLNFLNFRFIYIDSVSIFKCFHGLFPDGWGSKVKIAFVHSDIFTAGYWPGVHITQCLGFCFCITKTFSWNRKKMLLFFFKYNHPNYKSRKTSQCFHNGKINQLCCSLLKPVYKIQLLKLVGINQKIHLTANPKHLEGF